MNKQIFSLFGLFLLLFNNFSFSTQPSEQGNNAAIQPPSCQELEETRLLHPRIAQKYIDGLPEATDIIDSILSEERCRTAGADEFHDETTYCLNQYHTPMYLLEGPHGSGKSYATRAIASLLDRKLTIIDFFQFNVENPSVLIPIKDRLAPILKQNNEPRVVVLEDIERLSTYHRKNNDLVGFEKDNRILDLLPFLQKIEIEDNGRILDPDIKKQDENWMKSRLVILATTSCRDRIPPYLLTFFSLVKIMHPNLERRSIILKNLLESEDHIIDISICTPEAIEKLAGITESFSIRELKNFIIKTKRRAFARLDASKNKAVLEQEDLDKAFEDYYPYTEIGEATIKTEKEEAERRAKAAAEAEVERQRVAAAEAARRKAAAEEAAKKAATQKAIAEKWKIWPFY